MPSIAEWTRIYRCPYSHGMYCTQCQFICFHFWIRSVQEWQCYSPSLPSYLSMGIYSWQRLLSKFWINWQIPQLWFAAFLRSKPVGIVMTIHSITMLRSILKCCMIRVIIMVFARGWALRLALPAQICKKTCSFFIARFRTPILFGERSPERPLTVSVGWGVASLALSFTKL